MKWQNVISCRTCKYSLVNALGECVMKNGRFLLTKGQSLVIVGCFEDGIAWKVTCGSIPQPEPLYLSNYKEVDQRWRHVTNCSTENVLVYSPDTDVYTIGMFLSTVHNSKQVIVQLNPLE